MKHLFFIHSHITFQVAIAVVQKKGFQQNEYYFLGGRGFDPKDIKYPIIPFPFSDDHFLLYKNILKGWSYIKEFDAFIDNICREEFIFYCPHTYFSFSPLIDSHPLNRGYCLLEEGLTSYTSIVDMNSITPAIKLNTKQKILSKFGYCSRYTDRVFYRDDYLLTYCTSQEGFPSHSKKELVDVAIQVDKKYELLSKEIDTLLILDSSVETKAVSADSFISGFHFMIMHFSDERFSGKSIHIKLHPYQYVDRWFADRLVKYLKEQLPKIDIIELPSEVSIESIAVAGHADLYLGISSLAVYASRQGLNVYSFANRIADLEPSYYKKLNQQPQIFHNSVIFL